MNNPQTQAIYRIRRFRRDGDVQKKYEGTYEVINENIREVLAVGDLIVKAVFSEFKIRDHRGKVWQIGVC
ncbi:MAG: hypothetical protein JXK94_08815 [Deltaproteobacteria bacterium]|nr:hypothetical protein [Deltaproteobacteria bacterium]